MTRRYISITEAAEYLGISTKFVRRAGSLAVTA